MVSLSTLTSRFTTDVLPSEFAVTVTVPLSLAKFTLLPCVTASTGLPFACKFQPEFNTSRTVAASLCFPVSFTTLLSTTVVGLSMWCSKLSTLPFVIVVSPALNVGAEIVPVAVTFPAVTLLATSTLSTFKSFANPTVIVFVAVSTLVIMF